MRNCHIQNLFSVIVSKNSPSSIRLKYESNLYKRVYLSLKDFLTYLPVHFPRNMSSILYNDSLIGLSWYERNQIVTYLSTGNNPIDFFSNLSYHQYGDLKSDLKKLNPNYTFVKKSKYTLENYIHYFEEASKDLEEEEILKHVSSMKQTISIDDFDKNFICIDKNSAFYVLPYERFEHVPGFKETFQKAVSKFPSYLFSCNQREILFSFIDGIFNLVFLEDEKIEIKTYKKNEIDELIKYIDEYFTTDEEKVLNQKSSIVVHDIEHSIRTITLETCAIQVTTKLHFHDNFQEDRKFFKEKYNITARSKESLWKSGIEAMKKNPLSLPKPYLTNMKYPPSQETDFEMKEPFDVIHSQNKNDKKDFILKLKLLETNGVIEDTNELKPFEKLDSYPSALFEIPDLGELATIAPSFDEIIK